MNKNVLILFLLQFIFFGLFSQSIKVNETDKSTGKKKIETDYTTLLNNYPAYLYAKLKLNDTNYILELRGGDIGVATIEANDKIIIKLADSNSVTGYSTSKQQFTIDDNAKYYTHDYFIKKSDLELLARQNAVWIRKYAGKEFQDIPITITNNANLKGLSTVLLKTP